MILRKKYRLPRIRTLGIVVATLALGGCVTSPAPILTDGKAILGDAGVIYVFGAPKDGTREVLRSRFQWSGSRYVTGRGSGASEFTVHAFEGRDLIVQRTPALAPRRTEYGLARRVSEGVYLLVPISEDDADDSARTRFCTKTSDATCRISTPEQLSVFARATAAKEDDSSGVAVIVPDRTPPSPPPRQRR
jgi:hypothetical protein